MAITKLRRKFDLPVNWNKLKISYFLYSSILSFLGGLRLFLKWPDAGWQTNFLFLRDLENLLKHDFAHVGIFWIGTGHSLTAYRYFTYFSALFLGFDTRYENVLYYLVVWAISWLIGVKLIASLGQQPRRVSLIFLFLIPPVINSLEGAGSRGMEIGTYTGLLMCLFLLHKTSAENTMSSRKYFVLTIIMCPIIVFFFFGGYTAGFAFALLLIWLSQRLKKIKSYGTNFKFNLLVGQMLVWISIFTICLKTFSPGSLSGGPSTLLEQIKQDWSFPLRFLFFGNTSSIFSVQTTETFSPILVILLNVFAAIVTLLAIILALTFINRVTLIEYQVPLVMIAYGLGTALTLLLQRPNSDKQLLSAWYPLHFKIMLVGALVVLAVSFNRTNLQPFKIIVASLLIISLIIGIIFANLVQLKRENSEYFYFSNIAKASLLPDYLEVDSSGLTPLEVSLPVSLEAIRIQKKFKIGIYRDYDREFKKYELQDIPAIPVGQYYGDGWIGRDATLVFLNSSCKALDITVRTNNIVVSTKLQILVDGIVNSINDVTTTPLNLSVDLGKGEHSVRFLSSKSFIPAAHGSSQDHRILALIANIKCVK